MEDAKLKPAIETLLAKYPPEAVAVYLNAFNDMNDANWANLKTFWNPSRACNWAGTAEAECSAGRGDAAFVAGPTC